MSNGKKDVFAQIAAQRQVLREKELIEPQPPELPEVVLPISANDSSVAFRPKRKMETAGQLFRDAYDAFSLA